MKNQRTPESGKRKRNTPVKNAVILMLSVALTGSATANIFLGAWSYGTYRGKILVGEAAAQEVALYKDYATSLEEIADQRAGR